MVKISISDPTRKIRDKILFNVQAAVEKLAINAIIRNDNKNHVECYTKNKPASTPVIMINGEVKSYGRIPDIEEFTKWLEVKKIRIG